MSSGKLVYVKFKDHVIFRDHLNAMRVKPIIRETIGSVSYTHLTLPTKRIV